MHRIVLVFSSRILITIATRPVKRISRQSLRAPSLKHASVKLAEFVPSLSNMSANIDDDDDQFFAEI
jgi:hypothetical protein